MPTIDKPKEGEDVRVLHRNVRQLVDGINALTNMTAVWNGKANGVGRLSVKGDKSEIYIKVKDFNKGGVGGGRTAVNMGLGSVPNPSDHNQLVTVTAYVPGGMGGTVSFTIDGVSRGTFNLVNERASFTISTLTSGSHTIRAHFSGDLHFLPTDASSTHIVNALPGPNMTLTSNHNPGSLDQVIWWTADLRGNTNPIPTGNVIFFIDGNQFGPPRSLSGGLVDSQQKDNLAVGHHDIEADYQGNSNWGQAFQTLDQVIRAGVLIQLVIIPNPVAPDTLLDFYIRVNGQYGVPTGQVRLIKDGVAWSGTTGLNSEGVAHFQLQAGLPEGDYEIAAAYFGDGVYSPDVGDPVHLSVIAQVVSVTMINTVGYTLPYVALNVFANGGGSLFNQYYITAPDNFTGRIHFAITNTPWATLYFQGTLVYFGPITFGMHKQYPLPGQPILNGPQIDLDFVNGVSSMFIAMYAGGYEASAGLGWSASGHCWLEATFGSTPVVINGATTYVLELIPSP